jgi:hypothetical protein
LAKLGTEFGRPIVMLVVVAGVAVPLVVPAVLADDELLELLQPEITADAITTPATQPGSTSVRLM